MTANLLIGDDSFTNAVARAQITRKCAMRTKQMTGGRWDKLVVVDTPGLFDVNPDQSKERTPKNEVTKLSGILCPGPHVVILVLRMENGFTDEENNIVKFYVKLFGEEIFKHWIVVFSNGKSLRNEHLPQNLKDVLRKCNDSHIVLDPRDTSKRKENAANLFALIDQVVIERNKKSFYTNAMFEKVQKRNEDRARKIKQDQMEIANKKKAQFKKERDENLKRTRDDKDKKAVEQKYGNYIRQVDLTLSRTTTDESLQDQVREEYEKETGIWDTIKDVTIFLWDLFLPFLKEYLQNK